MDNGVSSPAAPVQMNPVRTGKQKQGKNPVCPND